ncbi:MAG: hypothetical protein AVDCRST_MAG89-2879 [uncultured Gemmatimonadetes bacterium]|uniref:Uncharacterized protein n=1 Tax=uncultured Gemmatimonadota bacterium TaxID=203437 RepID=A0A6J4LZL9_9BACT|nr:MAG: hypothetical protein AVDCRST_MAG89-2879 [uncultured Gemmatimonadota bacterium]
MNADRRRELEASLRGRLAEQPEAHRLAWVVDQLENYVERWIGFAEVVPEPLHHQLQGDLFGMIEIGEDVVDGEVARAPRSGELTEAWRRFRAAVARLRGAPDDGSPAELRDPLSGVLGAPEFRERSKRG